jgi:hypothetical protein
MNSFGKRLAAGLLGLAVVSPALAGPYWREWQDLGNYYFDQRRATQAGRIRQGVQRGDLTLGEGAQIVGDRARTELMRRDFMSDGYLSRDEARALNRAYNEDSLHIRDYEVNPYRQGSGYIPDDYRYRYGDPYRYRY